MSIFEAGIDDHLQEQMIEAIYAIDAHEDMKGIHLGTITSRNESHDSSFVSNRIDMLIKELADKGDAWSKIFLAGYATNELTANPSIKFGDRDKRYFDLHGISAGKYLTGLVYNMLPIESSEYGTSKVSLDFKISKGHVLRLKGKGDFDLAYLYKQDLDPEVDDMSPNNSDDFEGSEINYSMKFSASLFAIKP